LTIVCLFLREYLLGFRKRKNERRKKAKEDLTKKEKERRKELKQEVCLSTGFGYTWYMQCHLI